MNVQTTMEDAQQIHYVRTLLEAILVNVKQVIQEMVSLVMVMKLFCFEYK